MHTATTMALGEGNIKVPSKKSQLECSTRHVNEMKMHQHKCIEGNPFNSLFQRGFSFKGITCSFEHYFTRIFINAINLCNENVLKGRKMLFFLDDKNSVECGQRICWINC